MAQYVLLDDDSEGPTVIVIAIVIGKIRVGRKSVSMELIGNRCCINPVPERWYEGSARDTFGRVKQNAKNLHAKSRECKHESINLLGGENVFACEVVYTISML